MTDHPLGNEYMILSRRALPLAISFAVVLAVFGGCRTSQQEARRAAVARGARGVSATPELSRQVDSLLLIQEKLVEVIDSMTSLVSDDHERIRALEQELHQLEAQTGGVPVPPVDESGGAEMAPPPASVTAPSSFQDRYNAALREYEEKNYSSALRAFESLEAEDPNSALSGNYRYWEGECYYGEQQYSRALRTFESMRSEYPNSPKSAAAAYKIGECYEQLGDSRNARAAYERVIADYPSTEFRGRAEARLKMLR